MHATPGKTKKTRVSTPTFADLNVGHSGQLRPWSRELRGDGEHGEQTHGDPGGDGLVVDPEGGPRQDDDEDARQVGLEDVESYLSFHSDGRS